MTDQQPRPPLWRVMRKAAALVEDDGSYSFGYAAEIRAVADWLVPEEREPTFSGLSTHAAWRERQRLRRLLLEEAQRAEAGQ